MVINDEGKWKIGSRVVLLKQRTTLIWIKTRVSKPTVSAHGELAKEELFYLFFLVTCPSSSLRSTKTPILSKKVVEIRFISLPVIKHLNPFQLLLTFSAMSISFFHSIFRPFTSRWPLLIYAAAWTALLSTTVAVASFLPEAAFVWAISPSSSFSQKCYSEGFIRVPMDLPGEVLCLPAHFFTKFSMDLLVPPVFAAVVVAGSACLVRAMALWEEDLPRWVRLRFRSENPNYRSCAWLKPDVLLCVGTNGSAFESITVLVCSYSFFEFDLLKERRRRRRKRRRERKVSPRAFNFLDNGFFWWTMKTKRWLGTGPFGSHDNRFCLPLTNLHFWFVFS